MSRHFRTRHAMAEAEARWLEPDPEREECVLESCFGPCCNRRSHCPDPDKKADYEWKRRKE